MNDSFAKSANDARDGAVRAPDAVQIQQLTAALAAERERAQGLVEALQMVLNHYLQHCGDCGSWDPDAEQEVIDARDALAKWEG